MKINIPPGYTDLDLPAPRLKNWQMYREGKNQILTFKGEVKHEFKGYQSHKCKIFALLFSNPGKLISYKEIYNFYSGNEYPQYRRAGIHKDIQRSLNHLRNDLKDLPLTIKTDKGAALYISDWYDFSIKDSDDLVISE